MVDRPAAVAKAPFGQDERFQHVAIWPITKRNVLTLAKDCMAEIISEIMILAEGMSSRGLHDG